MKLPIRQNGRIPRVMNSILEVSQFSKLVNFPTQFSWLVNSPSQFSESILGVSEFSKSVKNGERFNLPKRCCKVNQIKQGVPTVPFHNLNNGLWKLVECGNVNCLLHGLDVSIAVKYESSLSPGTRIYLTKKIINERVVAPSFLSKV